MSEWLSLCSKIKDKYYFFLQNPGCFTVCRITVTIGLHVKAFWNVSRVQKDCKDLRWEIVNAKNTRQIRSADQKTAWLGPPATHGLTPASPWRHPSASLYPRPSDLPTGSLVHQAFAATTPVSVLCPHDWLLRPPFACKLKEAELALWLVCAPGPSLVPGPEQLLNAHLLGTLHWSQAIQWRPVWMVAPCTSMSGWGSE